MRIPRPSLRKRGPKDEDAALLVGTAPDDDAHLLRRTRLRLMAVSGAVTLLLLVVLGAAVYTVTANTYKTDSVGRLRSYADLIANGISGAPAPSTPAGCSSSEPGP